MTPPPADDPTARPRPRPRPATGLRRAAYLTAGVLSVGMAYVGVVLPGVPTTPWVLLAGYCFARSSPRLERWLRRSPLYGPLLSDWQDHGGVRRPVKLMAVGVIAVVVIVSILSGRLPWWGGWVVGGLAVCGVSTLLFIVPTIRVPSRPDSPASGGVGTGEKA